MLSPFSGVETKGFVTQGWRDQLANNSYTVLLIGQKSTAWFMEFWIGGSEDVQPANFTLLWRWCIIFSYNASINERQIWRKIWRKEKKKQELEKINDFQPSFQQGNPLSLLTKVPSETY